MMMKIMNQKITKIMKMMKITNGQFSFTSNNNFYISANYRADQLFIIIIQLDAKAYRMDHGITLYPCWRHGFDFASAIFKSFGSDRHSHSL